METSTNPKGPVDNSASPHGLLKTMPLNAARLKEGFWTKRRAVNRQVSLKFGYEMLKKAGNFKNLRIAAGWETGSYSGRNFYDEDLYKWLEALGWELGSGPDEELQRMADETIALLTAAQQPDGYLNSYYQVVEPDQKWADLDHGHELYCAGHFFQAAVAFQRAAGDDRLLQIACRLADHIHSVFGPGKKEGACGHPEVEMALVELYRATRNEDYLRLAQFFVNQRGKGKMRGLGSYGPEYHQDHVPVRQAEEAAGHAVRQMYLLTGMADLYLETGETALWEVASRLWRDIHGSKLYITGGVGSRFEGEAFGEAYELPPDQCYCETCAAIGSLMFNWRLLLITGDGRYADLIERGLYNGILSSPALDGKHFFYVNPLQLRDARSMRQSSNPPEGGALGGRPEWHEVACCPPNVMRLFASLPHYLATTSPAGLQVHQYAPAEIQAGFGAGRQVGLSIETEYPWKGLVRLAVTATDSSPWELRMRLPGWSRDPQVTVNGEPVQASRVEKGYLALNRPWQVGDVVELDLNIVPELVEANPRVDANRGCLAIQRGPLVYCLEAVDHPDLNLLDVQIDETAGLVSAWQESLLPEGVMVVQAQGYRLAEAGWEGELYHSLADGRPLQREPVRLAAIPYYAWANRGLAGMRVWIPREGKCAS